MFRATSNRSALSARLVISVDTRAIFPAAAKAWRQLLKAFFDTYRPELHYMRGPGPKWRERHDALQRLDPVRSNPMRMLSSRRTTCFAIRESVTPGNCRLRAYASHRRDTTGQSTTSSVLNALSDTPATHSALAQVTTALQAVLQ